MVNDAAMGTSTPSTQHRAPISKHDVVAALRRVATITGQDTVPMQIYVRHCLPTDPSSSSVMRTFGSWSAAMTAAGMNANPYTPSVSDEAALNAVREAAQAFTAHTHKPASLLTQEFYTQWRATQRGDIPNIATLRRRFGVWIALKKQARLNDGHESMRTAE